MSEQDDMLTINIPTSGDIAQDDKRLDDFARTDALIQAGMCPNGCGPLLDMSKHVQDCPKCGFVYQRYSMRAAALLEHLSKLGQEAR